MRRAAVFLIVIMSSAWVPGTAWADGLITPFIGAAFGGDAPETKTTLGVAAGFMIHGEFGLESDFMYAGEFYPPALGAPSEDLKAMMVSFLVGYPLGTGDAESGSGLRPYGLIGLGWLSSPNDENDFGMDFGGGLMGFMNRRFGVRGDLRYLRTVGDDDAFGVWCATAGLIVRY